MPPHGTPLGHGMCSTVQRISEPAESWKRRRHSDAAVLVFGDCHDEWRAGVSLMKRIAALLLVVAVVVAVVAVVAARPQTSARADVKPAPQSAKEFRGA